MAAKVKISEGKHTILCLDPGDHTGWFIVEIDEQGRRTYRGGTTYRKDGHVAVAELFDIYNPDIVVMESFHLYPGMAKSLSWNSFYPCEVIGVIRYICQRDNRTLVEQAPSIKKYSGGLNQLWVSIRNSFEYTEHTKDAFLHWRYFARQHDLE